MKTRLTILLMLSMFLLASCQDKALVYYNRGLDAIEEDDNKAAIRYFELSLQERERDADAHFNLGVAYYKDGQYEKALEQYKITQEYYAEDADLHYNMAQTYSALELYQSALREYDVAVGLRDGFYEALTDYGRLLLDMDEFQRAEDKLVHAITIKPSYHLPYIHLGWLYARTGKYHQATHYLYRGLKSAPNSVVGRLGLAFTFYKRNLIEQAIEEYEHVYVDDEENLDAILGLGLCYYEAGKTMQAESYLKNAIKLGSGLPEAHKVLGDLYTDRKEYVAALAHYRMAVQEREDYPEAHLGIGALLTRTGQYDQAKQTFEQILARHPNEPWTLYHLGQLYTEMEDIVQAKAYFEKSLEFVDAESNLRTLVDRSLQSLKTP